MDTAAVTATSEQIRALQAGFWRLGYTARSDRPDRLAVASDALGLDQGHALKSFCELTAGQAGYLLGQLRHNEIAGVAAEESPRQCSKVADDRAISVADGLEPADLQADLDVIREALAWIALVVFILSDLAARRRGWYSFADRDLRSVRRCVP